MTFCHFHLEDRVLFRGNPSPLYAVWFIFMQGSPEGGYPTKGQFSTMVNNELGCMEFHLGTEELVGEDERESRGRSLSTGNLLPTRKTEQMRPSIGR